MPAPIPLKLKQQEKHNENKRQQETTTTTKATNATTTAKRAKERERERNMFTEEGIFPIGDGLLDVDAERLKGLLVSHDINEIYEVEQTPFAR